MPKPTDRARWLLLACPHAKHVRDRFVRRVKIHGIIGMSCTVDIDITHQHNRRGKCLTAGSASHSVHLASSELAQGRAAAILIRHILATADPSPDRLLFVADGHKVTASAIETALKLLFRTHLGCCAARVTSRRHAGADGAPRRLYVGIGVNRPPMTSMPVTLCGCLTLGVG